MDRIAVSVFDNFTSALEAIQDLEDNGFSREDISVVAQDTVLRRSPRLEGLDIHRVLGRPAVATFRAIGRVMGSGYIYTYMQERPVETGDYSLINLLTEGGIPYDDAQVYAEAVRRGAILVAVRDTERASADKAADILDHHGALVMADYVREWRQTGWSRFNEEADPMAFDELNWPQNITTRPGEEPAAPEEERNWPMDITGSYEPSSESPEGESWPARITKREDETTEEMSEEEEINWPRNLVERDNE